MLFLILSNFLMLRIEVNLNYKEKEISKVNLDIYLI